MKTIEVKPNKKMFCQECGSQMTESLVGAETNIVTYFNVSFRVNSPYDKTDGRRQYVLHYKCPNSRWWNSHDEYSDDEVLKI